MLFAPLRIAFRILRLLVVAVVLYVAVTFVQVWLTSRENDPHSAGAALVFGTATTYTEPSEDLAGRLERALQLYRSRDVPLIVVTGGKRPGDLYTEAQISARWLEARGVPAGSILLGGGSDTWENVASVASALHARHVHSLLVVTDPFHEDRAMATTSGFSFEVSPAPSEHSPIGGAGLWGHLFQESLEVAAGRIVGYHALSDLLHS